MLTLAAIALRMYVCMGVYVLTLFMKIHPWLGSSRNALLEP